MWRLHAETPVWSDLVELLSPISDHYSAFPQRVEHLPSEAFSAELVVETLMLSSDRTPSAPVYLTPLGSFSKAFRRLPSASSIWPYFLRHR
jgi:hypothetical protein